MIVNKILFVLMPFLSFSQQRIIPKSGKISFIRKVVITDYVNFENDTKKVSLEMLKNFKENLLTEKKDSAYVEQILNKSKNVNVCKDLLFIDENPYVVGNIYKNNDVEYFFKKDNNSGTYNLNVEYFKENFSDSKYKIIKIERFDDELRNIKGFVCSKVLVTFTKRCEETNITCVFDNLPHFWEMWGTSNIDTKIHPVIFDSNILNNFYPLSIVETIEGINGFKIVYKVKDLKID